jgi:hypothetical protein
VTGRSVRSGRVCASPATASGTCDGGATRVRAARALAILAAIAMVGAAGCGGTRKPHTVLEVSKVFANQGLPFHTEQMSIRGPNGQEVTLPGKLNGSALAYDVTRLATMDTALHTNLFAWVFDTNTHARQALRKVPLANWGTGDQQTTRAVDGSVIVVGVGFVGDQKKALDAAIAKLR